MEVGVCCMSNSRIMEKDILINKLKDEMLIEIQLMERFFELEEKLQEAVKSKRWSELEKRLNALKKISLNIEMADKKRDRYFAALKGLLGIPPDRSFNEIVRFFDKELQDELLRIHTELKLGVLKVKSSTGRLGYLFRVLSDSMNEILTEIFPHRKGKIYSQNGRAKSYSEESFVVNQSL